MVALINPANKQPARFVRMERGYVALDTTQITPAVRWFSEAAIAAVNPVATCAEPPPIQGCELPPLVVTLTPDLAANVNASVGVVIKVVSPVSLWHESMAA